MAPVRVAVAILALGLLCPGCTRMPHPDVRTFPDTCPTGWRFLYTDHHVEHSSSQTAAVCERVDSARTPVRP